MYNYCTSVHQQGQGGSGAGMSVSTGSRGSSSSRNTSRSRTTTAAAGNHNSGAQFVGQELYKRLKDFLHEYLNKLIDVSKNYIAFLPIFLG